jgi:hypothetical protein
MSQMLALSGAEGLAYFPPHMARTFTVNHPP